MKYIKKRPKPQLINQAYAQAINAYLHLRGAGRELQAIALKNNPEHILMLWGSSILPKQILVHSEKFCRWLCSNEPDLASIYHSLEAKIKQSNNKH